MSAEAHRSVRAVEFGSLLLAVFAVAAAYSVVLPVLPFLVDRLLPGPDAAAASWHTGMLSAAYTLALFLFAPLWGRLADRLGSRTVIPAGLAGLGASLLTGSLVDGLPLLYLARFSDGAFAAAVTPAVMAAIAARAPSDDWRARRIAWASMSGLAGFLVGPVVGGMAVKLGAILGIGAAGRYGEPFLAAATLAFAAAGLAAICVRNASDRRASARADGIDAQLASRLLALAFVAAAAIGTFEIASSLRAKQSFGLDPYQIGIMFTECSLVMFLVQAVVFSPLVPPSATRWLLAPAFLLMAGAFALLGRAADFTTLLLLVAVIAAAAGVIGPTLTFWTSLAAGRRSGSELGRQTAAAALGQSAGSAAGGLLAGFPGAADLPFLVAGAVLLAGAVASLGLPRPLPALVGDAAEGSVLSGGTPGSRRFQAGGRR